MKSSGVQANGATRADVHCGWGSVWVPLEWGKLPDDTKELAIYIGRYKHVEKNGASKVVVPYADLVSQIKPTVRRLPANELPESITWSVTGQISCPLTAKGQRVLIEVLALDRARKERQLSNDLAVRLTEEALADSKPTEGPRSPGELTGDAAAVGRLIVAYPGPHDASLYR